MASQRPVTRGRHPVRDPGNPDGSVETDLIVYETIVSGISQAFKRLAQDASGAPPDEHYAANGSFVFSAVSSFTRRR